MRTSERFQPPAQGAGQGDVREPFIAEKHQIPAAVLLQIVSLYPFPFKSIPFSSKSRKNSTKRIDFIKNICYNYHIMNAHSPEDAKLVLISISRTHFCSIIIRG